MAESVIIPSQDEAAREIEAGRAAASRYGLPLAAVNLEGGIDWASYIERAQEGLGLSGSGQRSGTIYLRDSYPLGRTLRLDSHVAIEGTVRAKHHIGSSHGFYALQYFVGQSVLKWNKPQEESNYSNFGAGIHQVHVQSVPGVSGVSFRGSQQSARINNLGVRGFGPATGLTIGGDTFTVSDLFVDALKGGDQSGTIPEATGIRFDGRVYSVPFNNFTVHNFEKGLDWHDAHQIRLTNFETELTTCPLVSTYNSIGVTVRNCSFRHTKEILEVRRARWPATYGIEISGMMADHSTGRLILEGTEVVTSKAFDLAIEGDRHGLEVHDLRALRRLP